MSSDRVLFPELWGLILSDLSIHDLVHLSGTSHYGRKNVKSFLKSLSTKICTRNPKEAVWLTDMGCKTVNLDLSGRLIIDASMLGNVHTLDLSWTCVTDVSRLGNVHTLYLCGTGVTDVSMLGNVHTLDLRGTRVKDVSKLGNVNTLYLEGTHVTDVSMLKNVRIIR
jgi:hypothetical protein